MQKQQNEKSFIPDKTGKFDTALKKIESAKIQKTDKAIINRAIEKKEVKENLKKFNNYFSELRDKHGNIQGEKVENKRVIPISKNPFIPTTLPFDNVINPEKNKVSNKPMKIAELEKRILDGNTKNRLTGFNSDKTVVTTKINSKTKTFVPDYVIDNVTSDLPEYKANTITLEVIEKLTDYALISFLDNSFFKKLYNGNTTFASALVINEIYYRILAYSKKSGLRLNTEKEALRILGRLASLQPKLKTLRAEKKQTNQFIKSEKSAIKAEFSHKF